MSKREEFMEALAKSVLETDRAMLIDSSKLEPWDSLSVVATIAVIDDVYHRFVTTGQALGDCKTVGDLLALLPND